MLTPRLRERLSRLARGLAAEPAPAVLPAPVSEEEPAPPAPVPAESHAEPWFLHYDVESCGTLLDGMPGACLLVAPDLRSLLSDHDARVSSWMGLPSEEWGTPEGRLCLDIETAGLSAAPLFLIGTLTLEEGSLRLRQYLARDYAEEPAVLGHFFARVAGCQRLITFNGQTFDLPYLLDRAIYHRQTFGFTQAHTDLLAVARRQWRGATRDCRLATLETDLCRRRRMRDVAGADIPRLYHDFVRTRHWDLIAPVLHHNALDLLTMAELAVIASSERPSAAPGR